MSRPRFSLAFLLSLTAFVAAFLGYANYRRVFLERETKALADAGVVLTHEEDRPYEPTGFWPKRPHRAHAAFFVLRPNLIDKAGQTYTVAEAKQHYRELHRRLRALGIDDSFAEMSHYCASGGCDTMDSPDDFDRYLVGGSFWQIGVSEKQLTANPSLVTK